MSYQFNPFTGTFDLVNPSLASGGTTGQILAKNSDTDFDTEWINVPVTSLTQNRIAFGSGSNTLTDSADFVYSSGSLGVGTASPTRRLHINRGGVSNDGITAQTALFVDGNYNGAPSGTGYGGSIAFGYQSTTGVDRINASIKAVNTNNNYNSPSSDLTFNVNSGSGLVERLRIGSTGNISTSNGAQLNLNANQTTWSAMTILNVGSGAQSTVTIDANSTANNGLAYLHLRGSNFNVASAGGNLLLESYNRVSLAKRQWSVGGYGSTAGFRIRMNDDGSGGSAEIFCANLSGNVGINNTSPSAKLHVLSTTEQLRVGYDISNYYSTTIGATGIVTFNAVGSVPKFVFSDNIELTQTVTTEVVTSDTTVTIVVNGTTYKLLAKA